MYNYELISNRIKKFDLNIDSLYIEDNDSLNIIVDSNELHELRSCSKLLVAMAIGIAIENKLFSLDDEVYPYLKKFITNKCNIDKIKKWTVRTLLTHTTGYNKMLISNKEIIEMNLDKSRLLDYVLNYEIVSEPNKNYIYNNVEPFIISVLFKEKLNIDLKEYIDLNIFKKLQINNYNWENYGEYCPGCTGLYLKPIDFYKVGQLLLNNGLYNDIQVVPENWINEMCKKQIETPNLVKKQRMFPKYSAGYFTFISKDGYIFRDGTNGQYIIINRDKDLLITIMSSEKEMSKITEIFRDIF